MASRFLVVMTWIVVMLLDDPVVPVVPTRFML